MFSAYPSCPFRFQTKAPNEAMYYRLRAHCYVRLKDLKRAVSDLKEAINRDEKNDMDQHFLVEILLVLGNINDGGKNVSITYLG